MTSKRSHEGYLMVDHRASPGVDGMPRFMESATYTCSHCQVVVVLNPLRNRERAYCPKCDHYICDQCGMVRAANGGACVTFKQIVEEVQEETALAQQRGLIVTK